MRSVLLLLLVLLPGAARAGSDASLRVVPAAVTLAGARSMQQFVSLAIYPDGSQRDVTAESEWRVTKPDLARFAGAARLAAAADES